MACAFSRGISGTPNLSGNDEFAIQTDGGLVRSTVFDGGKMVRVEMGKVSFVSEKIPVTGPHREVINEKITVGGREFTFCAATIGNPHCVLVGRVAPRAPDTQAEAARAERRALPEVSEAMAKEFGPLLEMHPFFPRKTNVQFLKVLDRANIQIEIWERGAGYTLASGSSSSAAAAVAHKLGLCDRAISVHIPAALSPLRLATILRYA